MSQTTHRAGASRLRVILVLLALVASSVGLIVGQANPAAAANTESARIGMPFSGTWAYNTLTTASCGPNSNQTAHPECHELYSYHWSTDVYAGDGTNVKLKLSNATGGLSYTFVSFADGSCGHRVVVNVKVDTTWVGQVYFDHLKNEVDNQTQLNAAMSSGGVIGQVDQTCHVGYAHVHVGVKNISPSTGYSCYYDYSTATHTAGMSLSAGTDLGLLGADNNGVQQECSGTSSGGSSGSSVVNDGGGVGSATYKGDRLNSGNILYAGEYLASPNLRMALIIRSNGELVMNGPNTSNGKGYSRRWPSSPITGVDRLVMQGDGNLVAYSGSTPKWWSGTNVAGSYAIMQNDGNFAVRNPAGSSQWSSVTGGGTAFTYVGSDRLNSGEQLDTNQYIRSADGRYVLLMKSGGTLVLYSAGYHIVWYVTQSGSDRLVMQGDGNLVMYDGGVAEWSSGSEGADPRVIMQNDGNLVAYDGPDAIWQSRTGGEI